MSKRYVKISTSSGVLRKYGGSFSKIMELVQKYKKMSLAEFMMTHEHLTSQDYNTLKYEIKK